MINKIRRGNPPIERVKTMKGYERVEIETTFTMLMNQALNDNKVIKDAIKSCNKKGYAISFSFINGMCYTNLETVKNARKKVMKD